MKNLLLVFILLCGYCFASLVEKGQEEYDKGNYDKAKALWEEACTLNKPIGCANLGRMYFRAEGVERDNRIGKIYYQKACDLNFTELCPRGLRYTTKEEQEAKSARLIKEYEEECEANNAYSCYVIGIVFKEGRDNIPKNKKKAEKYLKKSCHLSETNGCFKYGLILEEKNPHEAVKIFEKLCNSRHFEGCLSLAAMYKEGKGIQKDNIKAKEYLFKACKLQGKKDCDSIKK